MSRKWMCGISSTSAMMLGRIRSWKDSTDNREMPRVPTILQCRSLVVGWRPSLELTTRARCFLFVVSFLGPSRFSESSSRLLACDGRRFVAAFPFRVGFLDVSLPESRATDAKSASRFALRFRKGCRGKSPTGRTTE